MTSISLFLILILMFMFMVFNKLLLIFEFLQFLHHFLFIYLIIIIDSIVFILVSVALSGDQKWHIFLVLRITLGVIFINLFLIVRVSDLYLWDISLYWPVLDFYLRLIVYVDVIVIELSWLVSSEIVLASWL